MRQTLFAIAALTLSVLYAQSPTILSTTPAKNALNVPLDTAITATFDLDMDAATINDTTFVAHGSYTGRLSGTIIYDSGTKIAAFTPASSFTVGEKVSVTMTTVIASAAGDTLVKPLVWNFTAKVLEGKGVFVRGVDYNIQPSLRGLDLVDLNRDGNVDLGVLNASSNEVIVSFGLGDGTFGSPNAYPFGISPKSITAADLDGDGDIDLAGGNYGSRTVSVILNQGDGTFSPQVDYGGIKNGWGITAADLDGDGDADLAVAYSANRTASVLLGLGDGTFGAPVDYTVEGSPSSVTAADLDNDGDQDLALTGDTKVTVLLGAGDGSFTSRTDYDVGTTPRSIAATDLNADGLIDLAVANYSSGTISVLLNQGDGTFGAKVDYMTGSSPMSVYTADLDNDGDADLAVSCFDSKNLSILFNHGDGTFANKIDYNLGLEPRSCKAADLDNDGDMDLVVVTDQTVLVLLNQNSIADLALSVDTLAFSPIQVGQTDTLDLMVYNRGLDSTLQVSEIKRSSSSSVFSVNPVNFSVPPGDSVTVAVIFAPAYWATSYFDSLTILSNDPHKPKVYAYLSGDTATLAIREMMGIPMAFALHGNYPNPFNPYTTIKYALKEGVRTTLKVYNLLGREVAVLVNEHQPAAYHSVVWDGRDRSGRPLPSGVYIARLVAGDFVAGIKMLLLK